MVNGTELSLLHTWCCTKWHINHPLAFSLQYNPQWLLPFRPNYTAHGSAKQPHPHLFFHSHHPIWLPPELLVLQYKERFEKPRGFIFKRGKREAWLWLPLTLGEWMGSETPLPANIQASCRMGWRLHSKGSQPALGERKANKRENVGQNQGLW